MGDETLGRSGVALLGPFLEFSQLALFCQDMGELDGEATLSGVSKMSKGRDSAAAGIETHPAVTGQSGEVQRGPPVSRVRSDSDQIRGTHP
jgi:hypothetical protein